MNSEIPSRPLSLAEAPALVVRRADGARFEKEGPRADIEYRDLGVEAATGGRIGAKINRALRPFEAETGWHWHDLTAHLVYVIRGTLTFRFAGVAEPVTLEAGDFISQPAGVPHNVIARSDDLEVLEITLPARYGTHDVDAASVAG